METKVMVQRPLECVVSLPAPAAQVSDDGREVWAWADALSKRVHAIDELKRLRERIYNARNQCGSCRHWMTRECPREIHNNRTGRSEGPSSGATKCASFRITASAKKSAADAEVKALGIQKQLGAG